MYEIVITRCNTGTNASMEESKQGASQRFQPTRLTELKLVEQEGTIVATTEVVVCYKLE